jgi:hypothetical protein
MATLVAIIATMTICLNRGVAMAKGYCKGELSGKKIRIVSRWNDNGI